VQRQFMSLSGEICLTGDRSLTSEALVYKCHGLRVSSTLRSESDETDSVNRGNSVDD